MLGQDYLTLNAVRLKSTEEWTNRGAGLCFLFPQQGAGRYCSGPVSERLMPGDVMVINAALGGRLGTLNGEEMTFKCFAFCFEHLAPLFDAQEIGLLQKVTNGFRSLRLYSAESAVAQECHRLLAEVPTRSSLENRSQLLKIVAHILTAEFQKAQAQRTGFVQVEEHLAQVFEKLSAEDIMNLHVDELAERFACSRRHLNRLFHQQFGLSVGALKMEMRLLKAVSLLRDSKAKVISIAEECGFNQLGFFNTYFKKRFGASPGQWRKLTVKVDVRRTHAVPDDGGCKMCVNGLCPWTAKSNLAKAGKRGGLRLVKEAAARRITYPQCSEAITAKPRAASSKRTLESVLKAG